MKVIRIHSSVVKELKKIDPDLRVRVAELLDLLAVGESLGLPVSRPMPVVAVGAHELRIKDRSGQYRVFYFTKVKNSILVFHLFKKKTQETPKHELKVARKRLKELL